MKMKKIKLFNGIQDYRMAKFFSTQKASQRNAEVMKLKKKTRLKVRGKIAWECLQAIILCYLLYKAM